MGDEYIISSKLLEELDKYFAEHKDHLIRMRWKDIRDEIKPTGEDKTRKDERDKLFKLLEPFEWSGSHTDYEDSWAVMTLACPFCFNDKRDGHKKGCVFEKIRDMSEEK